MISGTFGWMAASPNVGASIAALFADGEPGMWYDPSDFSTLFQDAAGLIPVTAVGQFVGRMLDKSGRGNHATQGKAANRPILQQDASGKYYLSFNGTSQFMETAPINFTTTPVITQWAGVRKLGSTATIVTELSSTAANFGAYYLASEVVARSYRVVATGTLQVSLDVSSLAVPTTNIVTQTMRIGSNPSIALSVNGGAFVSSTPSSLGAGQFGNYAFYIAARTGSSLFFNGRIYGLIVRGAASTPAQIAAAERYMAGKTGVII